VHPLAEGPWIFSRAHLDNPDLRSFAQDGGRVARPYGSALTDPGMRLSRTRLFLEVTRIVILVVSKGG